nr:unnamed protein product [Leishmania braziliensis]
MSGGPPPPPPPPRPGAVGDGALHPLSIFSKRPAGAPGGSYSSGADPAVARRSNLLSTYSQYTNSSAGARAPPPATTGGDTTPLPPPVRPLVVAGPLEANEGHALPPPPTQLAFGQPSGSLPPPPPRATLPTTAALDAPSAAPPPPLSAAAANGLRIGGGFRYAVPNYGFGSEAHPSVGGPPPPVSQPAVPLPVSLPQPPPPALPSSATQSILEHTEAEIQQEPVFPPTPPLATEVSPPLLPAPFSSPPFPAVATAGPPLATRVSGAALARPASSRASSNGRQSPRDLSEMAGHRVPNGNGKQSRLPLAEMDSITETSAAAIARPSCPSSRGSSILVGIAATSAAALESEGRRTPPAPRQSSSIDSGLRRGVPAFLQPSGGGSVVQRTLRTASSRVDSTTTSSRCHKLLEAALTSRGSRHASLHGAPFASLSAHLQQQPSNSVRMSQGAPMRESEGDATVAQRKPEAPSELHGQGGSAPTHPSSDNNGGAVTDTSFLVPEVVTLPTGRLLPGTGYSVSSRSVRQPMGGNGGSLAWDAALLANPEAGESKDMAAGHDGLQQVDAPPQRLDPARGDSGGRTDAASVDSHLSGPLGSCNGRMADEVVVSGAEVHAILNPHSLHFDARESLATLTDEAPEAALRADGKSAARYKHSNAFTTDSDPTAASMTLVNPFRAMAGRNGGDGTAASPPPPPTASRGQLSCQRQQWQHSRQQSPLQHDAPYSGFQSSLPPSSYPGACAKAPEQLPIMKNIPTEEAVGATGPPLPPLPRQQQQQPPFASGSGDSATATEPATGFTTPRMDGARSMPQAQQQQQQQQQRQPHPLPMSCSSNSHVPHNMSRGPYAASPYVRGEDARAMVEESPLPLRPPSCDSVPQMEEALREATEQGEHEFGAINSSALNCMDGDGSGGAQDVGRFMWDESTEDGSAAGQYLSKPQCSQHTAPLPLPAHNRGTANSFSAILTHAQSKAPREFQKPPPQPPTQEPQDQEQRRESQSGQSAPLIPPLSTPLLMLSTKAISKSSTSHPPPGPASPHSTKFSESDFRNCSLTEQLQRPLELNLSPGNVASTESYHGYTSVSNPFAEPDENFLFNSTGGLLLDATNAFDSNTVIPRSHQALKGSLDSVQSMQAQHEPPPHPQLLRPSDYSALSVEPSGAQPRSKDHPAPPMLGSDPATAPPFGFTGDEGAPSTAVASSNPTSVKTRPAAVRTPGSATLVNPFSKSAQNSGCYLSGTSANISGGGALSRGTSLTGSFAGGAARKKPHRSGAPCFAIFVGGATLLPGTQGNSGSDRRVFSCIAACFNLSSGSPLAKNSGWSPLGQSTPLGSPQTTSVRSTSQSGATRTITSPVPRPLWTGPLGGNTGICLSFCSVTEALTARGSVVDRKGIRGTEYGRSYVRALTGAVLPCALLADKWVTRDEATAREVAGVMEALKDCVPAPLGDVVEVMLMDALPQKNGDDFVWRDNGGRRLAELLTTAAQADSRRRAATASSRSAGDSTTVAAGCTKATREVDALGAISPLNPVTATVGYDPKERSAALCRVEDLLCRGQRVEAVEAALEANLYAHALLISMMCPTKDLYLRSVQAVMQQELSVASPLARAYCIFNEMPLPPLVLPPLKADEEEEVKEGAAGGGRSVETAQQQHKRQRQMFLRDQEMLQQTWRRQAAVLLANFTRHSGDGLLQLATTLHQFHLVVEAHTCLLLLHLTPLGMAGPARAGAEPLPPASSLSPEDVVNLLPRPDQRQVMEEIRRRIGVVGGAYHPTQGCRESFLTPLTTLITQLVWLVSARLDARAPPLSHPESTEPPVPFHGLPNYHPRSDIGYRMMQVLWLRELGLGKEFAQALHALLQRLPPPLAFSLRAPPRTLNELVYLFGGVPPPSPQQPPEALDGATPATRGELIPESEATTKQSSQSLSVRLPPHLREGLPQDTDNDAGEVPRASSSSLIRATSEVRHSGPPPPLTPQERRATTPQQPFSLNHASLPSSSPGAADTTAPLTCDQRTAVLQPPERPAPSNITSLPQLETQGLPLLPPHPQATAAADKPDSASAKTALAPTAKKLKQPAPRRSRSLDALRNFFFRRGNSEATGEEKADEAKPMHLDTEKPPTFDPVTGRWLFDMTEEERRLQELAKAGPPKMAPKADATAAWGSALRDRAPLQQPAPDSAPRPGNARAGSGTSAPVYAGGGTPTPRPAGCAPVITGRNAPPTVPGRGAARPGGRPQYVDMFNSPD